MGKQNLRPPTIAVTPQEYQQMTSEMTPKPTVMKNTLWAFGIGGLICAIGQIIMNLIKFGGLPAQDALNVTTVIMIFLGALLTGLGVYDDIVKRAGAGAIVPITGFANSIVAPAMEFKSEGYVAGVGARLFTVAGPVLVYGLSVSVFVGIIYYFIQR